VIDSQRLCSYACKHADELKATPRSCVYEAKRFAFCRANEIEIKSVKSKDKISFMS
jgi:hypothetical protein